MSRQVDLAAVPRHLVSLEKRLCELFGGRVLPNWYLKLPDDFYESWPREGYERMNWSEQINRRQWWLEKATELLVEARPDKGLLRAAIESQQRNNPELADKLRERLRIWR